MKKFSEKCHRIAAFQARVDRAEGSLGDHILEINSYCGKSRKICNCQHESNTHRHRSRHHHLAGQARRQLGIKADDQLFAEATAEGLLLRPAMTAPVEIYSDGRIAEFDAAEAELGEVLRRKRPVRRTR